ncbi:hypothetical protein N7491_011325 [Penicillium cf. griseofulvum]|uniref:Uncharacterized protein n=1 Tax=Penicillium cf. griseofulvum TaxID=2972120 RepID=A0A9W9JS22_9EURO|nr:hypothetical protein N7472_004674 [Penicillium cf. griseofulvum]KAJ5416423.1 hypothetical protein N7491_011325 [Penicillium cf. griseofulvum]KAJ5442240.1 hypothetical protein N7445_005247 [Penicillium cf. griseofulvum]
MASKRADRHIRATVQPQADGLPSTRLTLIRLHFYPWRSNGVNARTDWPVSPTMASPPEKPMR